jgi:diketogulonate reductase-like aldo/keto reductase
MSRLLSNKLILGPKTPLLMYGTAWKEEKTADLTETAFKLGFTAVDTANYPTGYNEPLTGDGIQAALKSGLKREDLFVSYD